MNLGEAQSELGARGFDFLSSTRTAIMLNDAKNEFEDSCPFPWLETTTTGTAPLTISDLKYVLFVQDTTNDVELQGLAPEQIALFGDDISQAGSPEFWWLDGTGTLTTWPLSSSVQLLVRYVKFSPELSASSDTPLIPTRYHNIWVDLAVVRAYRDTDNFAAAAALQTAVAGRMSSVVEVYVARNRQGPESQTIRYASGDW